VPFCVLQVAAKELHALLAKPSLDGIALLVLGNKNDLPGALGTQQLIQQLELQVGEKAPSRAPAVPSGED
jgi:hypothetical protein